MSEDPRVLDAIEKGELHIVRGNRETRFLATTQEIWQIFEPLLKLASEQQKKLIYLRYRWGLTLKEASRELSMKPGTASTYLRRFGAKVRRYLAKTPRS